MVILHIAAISRELSNGVCVVVPQHIKAQKKYADIGFINISNILIPEIDNQFNYTKPFYIERLPSPFNKPDLVVFHECYRIDYLAIARNLNKQHVPYIIIPHGELGREAQKKKHLKKVAANILLFNSFTRSAAAIQCLSKQEYDNTFFGKQKIVGPNGVSIPTITKDHFSRNGVKFLYIGRLDAFHKGLDLMMEAVRISGDYLREHNCHLEIYGPDRVGRFDHVKSLIEKNGVQDIVSLNHEIYGEEKEKKLLDSDVFIQTSRFEGMPLGILEALSYGLPCLVTEGTTLGEAIQRAGAGWCACNESSDIAKAFVQAVEDRTGWERMSEKAVKYVSESFEWDIVARMIIEKYSLIANNKNEFRGT